MSSTDLGRHYFRLGPFIVEWFDGGGYVPSNTIVRYGGVIIAIMIAEQT